MKHGTKSDVYAKVIGHELFRPDPKNDPKLELVKVKLEGQSVSSKTLKRSKFLLIMEKEDAFERARLGSTMLFSFAIAQGELDLDGEGESEGADPPAGHEQESMEFPAPEATAAPARGKGRRPLGVVKGGKGTKPKGRAERVAETFRPRTPAPDTDPKVN